MPKVNIQGLGSVNFPDTMTAEQIQIAIETDILPKQSAQKTVDPTQGMSGTEKFAAGAGKAVVDLGRGVRQIAEESEQAREQNDRLLFGKPMGSPERRAQLKSESDTRLKELQGEIEESRRLDAPLMKTGAGMAGNLAGNVAAAVPTAFIPGANTLTGSALIGSGLSALSPVTQDESRIQNAATGAVAGGIGYGAGKLLARGLRPIVPAVDKEQAALVKAAAQSGIPLRASQTTGSKPLALTESVMENLPFTSGNQIAQKSAQKSAFNTAVLKKAGIISDKATPEVLATQKKSLGGVFEDIAERNVIDFNKGVTDKLADIGQEASRRLAKPEPITNTIDDILSDVNKSGFLDGKKYQGWRETLGRMARGNDSEAHYASQVKRTLDSAFSSQISGADAAAWKQASTQYGNLKNIMQAMGGAGKDSITGNIPPSQLAAALTRQVGKEGKALGRGDLNELSNVGRSFISENLPDSGTAQRTFYQNLLTGNLAGAIPGAGIGYYEGGPEGALIGAGIGAGAAVGGPKLAQALMNSKAGQAYLTKGAIPPFTQNLTQAHRDALAQALRIGATGGAMQVNQ